MLSHLRVGLTALALLAASLAGGCTHPCERLKERVCDELKDKHRCELMQQQERRKLLTKDTCRSILKSLAPK